MYSCFLQCHQVYFSVILDTYLLLFYLSSEAQSDNSLSVTFGLASQCQALIEELLASHSTDLQQRAYELQAVIALDPQSVESVLPFDASCEDIEVISLLNLGTTSLPFCVF